MRVPSAHPTTESISPDSPQQLKVAESRRWQHVARVAPGSAQQLQLKQPQLKPSLGLSGCSPTAQQHSDGGEQGVSLQHCVLSSQLKHRLTDEHSAHVLRMEQEPQHRPMHIHVSHGPVLSSPIGICTTSEDSSVRGVASAARPLGGVLGGAGPPAPLIREAPRETPTPATLRIGAQLHAPLSPRVGRVSGSPPVVLRTVSPGPSAAPGFPPQAGDPGSKRSSDSDCHCAQSSDSPGCSDS